jgi:hypothetical protein
VLAGIKMNTHIVIIEFAKKYGIKEGLILTEICRRAYTTGSEGIPFSVAHGTSFFLYLSEKQIRLALQKLKTMGAVSTVQGSSTLDRTLRYRIHKTVYQFYCQIVMANQLSLPDEQILLEGGE